MAFKIIQCVFVPNLKLFGEMNTELWTKEVGQFPTTLHSFFIRTSKFGPEAQAVLNFWGAF